MTLRLTSITKTYLLLIVLLNGKKSQKHDFYNLFQCFEKKCWFKIYFCYKSDLKNNLSSRFKCFYF